MVILFKQRNLRLKNVWIVHYIIYSFNYYFCKSCNKKYETLLSTSEFVHASSKIRYTVKNVTRRASKYLLLVGWRNYVDILNRDGFLNMSGFIIINNRVLPFIIYSCIVYQCLFYFIFFLSRKENVLMTSTLYQTRSIDAHQL